jgi:hypothetical protein
MNKELKSRYILESLINYVAETGYPKTPVELANSMDIDILVNNNQEVIGLIGYEISDSSHLGKVGSIHLVYIEPKHRNNWTDLNLLVGKYMKRLGANTLELFLDNRISKWFEENINSKPTTNLHYLRTEDYIKKFEGMK